jgi:iron complex outermembrane recepter protein
MSVFAQKPGGILTGIVTDNTGDPIAGAAVYFHETRSGAYTDGEGHFEIKNISPGLYHLHVSAIGYVFKAQNINIGSGTQDVHLVMVSSELKMRDVVIESESDKREQKDNSQTLDVVNRKYIEKYSSGNFMNTLERLPGISAIRTGVGISKPVIRGMSFNRVLVVDNGIRQEGQQWGADHGLEIDEMNADRVEILKGPASLMYGSDAIGGVIQIRPAAMPREGHWQGSLLSGFRSVNDLYSFSGMGSFNHKGNMFRIRMSGQDYGDYKVPATQFRYNRYVLPIYDGYLKNTSGQDRNISATAGIQRKWGSSTVYFSRFHQTAGFFPGAFGIPREYSIRPDGDRRNIQFPRQETEHLKLSSHTQILFRKNWLEVDAGYQLNHRQELAVPHVHTGYPIPEGNSALDLQLHTQSLNTRYHLQLNPKVSAITGFNVQAQKNNKGGFEHLIPAYSSVQGGAFVFTQYKPNPQLVLNAGLRYDAGDIRIQRFAEPVYNRSGIITDTLERNRASHRVFANVAGSAGLAWNFAEFWSVKWNMSSDFRYPTVAELASNGVHHGTFRHVMGESYLSPERGYQADLHLGFENSKFRFRVTPFFSYFTNYIFLSPSGLFSTLPEGGQVFRYQEAPARFWGGEIETEFKLHRNISLQLSYEYVEAQNLETGVPLPFTPPGCLSQELEWSWLRSERTLRQAFASITLMLYQDQNRTDRNELPTAGYGLIHLSQGCTFMFGQQEMRLLLQVQNLTNRTYLNHMSRYRLIEIPEPGRNFILTAVFPLQGKLKAKKKNIISP